MFEATSREFMNSDLPNHHHHHQQQQESYGLMRYNSAPSSFFANHLNSGGGGGGGGGQHFESMFSGFMSCDGSGDSDSHSMHEAAELVLPRQNGYSAASSQMMYHQNTVPVHHLPNHDSAKMSGTTSIESSFRVMNPMQVKTAGTGNCSNLTRQNSSPAGGLFSKLTLENGFAVMRDGRNFRAGNGTNNGATSPSTSRLNNHISFSSRPSSCSTLLPQIAEIGNESIGASSPENGNLGNGNGSGRCYIPGFANDSWDDCTFPGLKRIRESDERMFCVETQNEDSGNHTHGLIHHLSLPKTSTEMAEVEKYLKFQGNIPCKIRAKRGCATHPRSIAERVRRTRISEKMRKLQDLFPNMDKQTNTADMLDLAVEYIKNLQKQVKKLTDTSVNCTCSSIKKQYSHESYPTA